MSENATTQQASGARGLLSGLFNGEAVRSLLPVFVLLALVAAFGVSNARFLSLQNLTNLLEQSAVLMVVAFGVTFVIIAGSIDLSIGSIVAFSGVLAAVAVPEYGLFALVVGVLVGLGAGLVNGVLFAYVKIPSFLVTLGMLSILQGAALMLTEGFPVTISDPAFIGLASGNLVPGIPNIVLWSLVALLVAVFLARVTRLGRYAYMIGSAEQAARMSGVPVERYKVAIFALSGIMCGLAGTLLAARLSTGASGMESLILLDAIAAVIIGGTALTGGVGGPLRTFLGVLIISVITNGLALAGVNPFLQIAIKGAIVILAVAISIERSKLTVIK